MARPRSTARTTTTTRRSTTRRRTAKRQPPKLTNLETKLGEVIGLAMAAQGGTDKIAKLVSDRRLKQQLKTMKSEAAAAEKGGTVVAGSITGKKAAIMKEAREVKKKATKMMTTYLDRSADGLDGFEFLTMAEAAEVGHWTVLDELNKQAKHPGIRQLTKMQIPIQRRHLRDAMAGSVALAAKEDANGTG
jgi:hypothetical protein